MSNDEYPKPPSHRVFNFQPIIISSDFDSGNCCNALKIGNNQFHIWIATDHSKNNYRTWFHFSVAGASKGSILSFTIKNMQNQSRLLSEGLVPVYREEGSVQWRRISEKVNLSAIEYNDGWIEWTFKHYFKSTQKHYFAFFYPWSNEQNDNFLKQTEEIAKQNQSIYFHRAPISKSIEGRPIEFVVISSTKNKSNKQQHLSDEFLFKNQKKPHHFINEKPGIIITARVHPGQIPGSHVMTGIIKALVSSDLQMKLLRDQFVFYIFPILNPDGVARGHYRVDTNGINLNRCYINPSPRQQPSIYAVKKIIMHLHAQNRFFAYLDLHAHAARKGTFIYGNYSNQIMKQVDACIFPKLLSMNSIDFQYEGSNFTEKNMYSKDRGDHISKQGSSRVAMFKATKNAYCWTMECNYNISRINNVLQNKKSPQIQKVKIDENSLDFKLIVEYKQPQQTNAKQFFTIQTYHKLGRQVCQTFLDLTQKNPQSRIENPQNYFKNVANLKMNLAVALLRMAPDRFESFFKKIYSGITNSENPETIKNSLKALYFIVVKNAKIQNINNYVKSGDQSQIILPESKKVLKKIQKPSNFRTRQTRYNNTKEINQKQAINDSIQIENISTQKILRQNLQQNGIEDFKSLALQKTQSPQGTENMIHSQKLTKVQQNDAPQNQSALATKASYLQKKDGSNRIQLKLQEFKLMKINTRKLSKVGGLRETTRSCLPAAQNFIFSPDPRILSKLTPRQLPFIGHQKYKDEVKKQIIGRRGSNIRDQFLFIHEHKIT